MNGTLIDRNYPRGPKTVLLVEDNADDVFFMQKACKTIGVPHFLNVVADGQAAIDYLAGKGIYQDRTRYPLPDLVLLDLKMPRRTGHEVLEWLRQQPQFKNLPVVILTASTVLSDLKRAYSLGTTSYFMKQTENGDMKGQLKTMFQYWLQVNIMPHFL